tara:strand:- start:1703 stop:2569 length:867 start_codon:yes stop_codon:yes gene_type:complete
MRYVVAVADRLSFTAAARDLNVSQPALSQQIRQVEDELGLQLFARTPHRVTITQAGQLVVDHARRTLDSVARMRDAVAAFRGLQRGKLRIAVTQSFNALHMTSVLALFLKEYPSIDVTALEWSNNAIIAGVADGTLDLGVAFGPIDAQLATQVLYEDRLMLTCASGHSLASPDHVPIAALMKEVLALLTPDYGTRRSLDRYFEAHGITPQRVIELNTFASILKLVEAGLCVSVMPGQPNVDASKHGGVIFRPLAPAPPSRSIQLLLPPTAARSPAATAFASILRDRFA